MVVPGLHNQPVPAADHAGNPVLDIPDIGAYEYPGGGMTTDTDGDGLADYAEIHIYGTDPRKVDTDGDGYSDWVEVAAGSDPRNPNSYPQNSNPVSPVSGQSDGGGGGCFIATAAFGGESAPEVVFLRQFRDDVLMANWPGRQVVRLYYTLSPPLAEFIAGHELLRQITRCALRPIIFSIQNREILFCVCIPLLAVGKADRISRRRRAER
jgi:hypothetical protein